MPESPAARLCARIVEDEVTLRLRSYATRKRLGQKESPFADRDISGEGVVERDFANRDITERDIAYRSVTE